MSQSKAAALLAAIAEKKAAALPKEPIPLATFLFLYVKAPNKWQAMESNSYAGAKQLIEFLSPITLPTCLAYQKPIPDMFATYEITKLAELLGGIDWRIIAWSLLEMNGVVIKQAKPAQMRG